MAQPKFKMLDCWCQKQEALTMTVEFARMRVAKIRKDLAYSNQGLNKRLGLINENNENDSAVNACANWTKIK